ncbi:hypothetical protein YC2023_024512 [Brassica napus]
MREGSDGESRVVADHPLTGARRQRRRVQSQKYLFIYTRKKLELHNKMSLIYCLMDLEGGCKSTPNNN